MRSEENSLVITDQCWYTIGLQNNEDLYTGSALLLKKKKITVLNLRFTSGNGKYYEKAMILK